MGRLGARIKNLGRWEVWWVCCFFFFEGGRREEGGEEMGIFYLKGMNEWL